MSLSGMEVFTLRKKAGFTRAEMAEKIKYSDESLHDWERRDKKHRPMPPNVEVRFLTIVNGIIAEHEGLRVTTMRRAA
jgi:DNA-binding transcriptional regulator YiaG